MKVSIQEICKFACTEPRDKNFFGGESILDAGHLIKCDLQASDDRCQNGYKVIAVCMKTSHLKDAPHEIMREILKDGRVMGMSCSCKAGLSETCKHAVATLLFCNRNDFDKLPTITCTDKKCVWSTPHKASHEKYQPHPLSQHECFRPNKQNSFEAPGEKHKTKNSEATVHGEQLQLTEDENEILRNMAVIDWPLSGHHFHVTF